MLLAEAGPRGPGDRGVDEALISDELAIALEGLGSRDASLAELPDAVQAGEVKALLEGR